MSTYAAYYNLSVADKNEQSRRASARSTSSDSTSSQEHPTSRRSSFQKVMASLRPTTETITPAGIYSPIIKRGSLFSHRKLSAEEVTAKQNKKRAAREEAAKKDIQMSRELRDLMHAAA